MRANLLLLPTADLTRLKDRVKRLAEDRPAVYRMVDPAGRVLYVGKARKLRARLLTYFRAKFPDDKAARILQAAADIEWDYAPSEFAALLGEIRAIKRLRPPYNIAGNRSRQAVFITMMGGIAPRLAAVKWPHGDERVYGPFGSVGRVREAIRVLNDLLGLRDCTPKMPMVFADQGDLFAEPRQAACIRYDIGQCLGPCAGLVTQERYQGAALDAVAFLEARAIRPVDRVVTAMEQAAAEADFETAARWREKFEALEWLLAASVRARAAVDLLSFVYRDPGAQGDDRAYLIRRGTIRAAFPYPTTPIELEAFRAAVTEESARAEAPGGVLPVERLDEVMVVMAWFRKHPDALRRTTPIESWATVTN
ncbi:MAG: nuclease [Gemmatimonadales bacterium]